VPYDLIKLCQLEKFFVNTLAGARGYIAQEHENQVTQTRVRCTGYYWLEASPASPASPEVLIVDFEMREMGGRKPSQRTN
jgi:hypothetical protein